MKANVKKVIVVSSVALLLLANASPVFALNNQNYEPDAEYTQFDAGYMADELASEVTFSNADVLKAAENLYIQGLFTKEQYNIVSSAFTQRLGIKGQNKVVNLGNGMTDVYINNVTWNAMIGLGGAGAGLLLGAIPGLSAGWAAVIGGVAGAAGSSYLDAERGVIVRMQQVYVPPTQYSGPKNYPRVIGIREQ